MLTKNLMSLIIASVLLSSAILAGKGEALDNKFPLIRLFAGPEKADKICANIAKTFERLFRSGRQYPENPNDFLIYLKYRNEDQLRNEEFNIKPLPTSIEAVKMLVVQFFLKNNLLDFRKPENIELFKKDVLAGFASNILVNNSFEKFNPEEDLFPDYIIKTAYHAMLKEKRANQLSLSKDYSNADDESLFNERGYYKYTRISDQDAYDAYIKVLTETKNAYFDEVIPFFHEYVLFRQMTPQDNVQATQFILDQVKNSDKHIPDISFYRKKVQMMIELIIAGGVLIKENPFGLVKEIALRVSKETKTKQVNQTIVLNFWNEMFSDIIFFFDDRKSKTTTTYAKDLIKDYFELSNTVVNEGFDIFLARKHANEGIRAHKSIDAIADNTVLHGTIEAAELFNVFKLYVFKTIEMSFKYKIKIISKDDFSYIITNFGSIFNHFNRNQIKLLNDLQTILFSYTKDLEPRFQLYDGLYNMILHACAHSEHSSKYTNTGDQSASFLYFDSYLNIRQGHNSKKGSIDTQSSFPTNLHIYYPFYKIVNIAHNPAAFIETTVSFLEFNLEDDQLIHEFTLKPQIKEILEVLKNYLFVDLGFNYQNFNKVTIDKDAFKMYDNFKTTRNLANELTQNI